MSKSRRVNDPNLTDSWAPVDTEDGSTESFTSDDEPSPPRADLTRSKLENLNEALSLNGHGKPQNTNKSTKKVASPRMSTTSARSTALDHSRQRSAKSSSVPNDEPQFIMPRLTTPRKNMRSSTTVSPGKEHEGAVSRRISSSAKKRGSKEQPDESNDYLSDPVQRLWNAVVLPTLRYAFSILQITAGFAKPIIAYALALYLLVGFLVMARNMVSSRVTYALSPLCHLPGAGHLNLPFCSPINRTHESGPVEFDKLISAQSAFEDILTASSSGAQLPVDMKRSEISIRDLKYVVQYSTLPSRNELVFEFTGFVDTARLAASELTKYNSRIGRAVDRILNTNRWTLQVLDGISETEAQRGSVSRFVSNYLDVFAPFRSEGPLTQDVLFDQYIRHTSAIEEQIHQLIQEAQALLVILQNLDDRLDVIAGIAMRDGIRAQGNKDDLFAYLWTKLGGNRASVAKLNAQLAILKDVGSYRRMAWAHVSGTIIKLQEIEANLEDLRERVARPELVGVGKDLPLEVHVREILMGVERLQAVRDEGRKVESQHVKGILERNEKPGVEDGRQGSRP